MCIGSLNSAGSHSGATPTTGDAIAPSGPVAIKIEDTLVSSLVSAESHAGLLASMGPPPEMWDLRSAGAG